MPDALSGFIGKIRPDAQTPEGVDVFWRPWRKRKYTFSVQFSLTNAWNFSRGCSAKHCGQWQEEIQLSSKLTLAIKMLWFCLYFVFFNLSWTLIPFLKYTISGFRYLLYKEKFCNIAPIMPILSCPSILASASPKETNQLIQCLLITEMSHPW